MKINKTVAKISNLKANGLKIILNMTMALWMKLNKFHSLLWIKLDRFYNLTILKTNLDISSGIKFIYKLAKSLIKINNKIYKSKIYNKAIDDLIYKNKWCKVITKKL